MTDLLKTARWVAAMKLDDLSKGEIVYGGIAKVSARRRKPVLVMVTEQKNDAGEIVGTKRLLTIIAGEHLRKGDNVRVRERLGKLKAWKARPTAL